ncbi:hypothetical protein GM415_03580 [Pseudodesulfovibrio cashew]|uniref:Uncharacterized protein n=1 Tax=Pseudodesulfovibrio cashew TaxID=2678688 RepID=A0A6I6JDT5_9BACT|nr:hypothetical protein [Pseudodesulfovibrio cashew]QGY39240.1 hypothetical protein GM415_03580 [Pseudodesulfovibrio cashew]
MPASLAFKIIGGMVRDFVFYIAIASYAVPAIYKTINLLFYTSDIILAALSVASWILVLGCAYGTSKGIRVCKWIVAMYLSLCGILMLPWFMSPAIASLTKRFALGALGLWWIAASLWIIKYYQPAKIERK